MVLFAQVMSSNRWMPRPAAVFEYRKTIVQTWLNDIVNANQMGTLDVTIYTPTPGPWPHPKEYFGERLSSTLFRHGIIDKLMTIHIESTAKYK